MLWRVVLFSLLGFVCLGLTRDRLLMMCVCVKILSSSHTCRTHDMKLSVEREE